MLSDYFAAVEVNAYLSSDGDLVAHAGTHARCFLATAAIPGRFSSHCRHQNLLSSR
jgi:hypothetical protein